MRLLGLDVGSKTIGVAVSDPLGITAQAVMTILIDEDRHNFGMRSLKKLVREYEADGFVRTDDTSAAHRLRCAAERGTLEIVCRSG